MATSGKVDDSAPDSSPSRAACLRCPAPAGSVLDLRKLLAERFPHAPAAAATHLVTGLSFLDEAIGGGLPKSAITELISPEVSAGSASLIHALLQGDSAGETPACSADKRSMFSPVALIDGCDSFDPQPLGNACLRYLLWVRCTKALEAIKAADLLLRDGNFPLVIVDFVLNAPEELRKIPKTNWYRLQRLIESVPCACLVLTRQGMVSSAQLKIVLENVWDLASFEEEDAISRLRIRVQRSHLQREEIKIAGAS
jgi:hypothetical protein